MTRLRCLILGVAIALQSSAICNSVRADLVANVRVETGQLRIANDGPADFRLTGYQITSPDNSLLVGGWLPISGRLDANGDMSFDSDDAWLMAPGTAGLLAEGEFNGNGGLLSADEGVYLGPVWDVSKPRTLEVQVSDDIGPVPIDIPVSYLPTGDYDENGIVDQADYTLWKSTFGATGLGLLADGNADQVVDLADFTLWRDHLGATMLPADTFPFLIASSTVIPEPCGAELVMLGVLLAVGFTGLRNL